MTESAVSLNRLPRTISLEMEGASPVLQLVDQTKLPRTLDFLRTSDWRRVVSAVKRLEVRGAPALGVAGAASLALWAHAAADAVPEEVFDADARRVSEVVADARPTAVNLRWGVTRALSHIVRLREEGASPEETARGMFALVKEMEEEDVSVNRAIGANGAELLPKGSRVLTHCNAGSLATVFFGTALGIVYAAAEAGKIERVYADETRPVGQGARITVWELSRAGVPATLICDDMAASLMAARKVDAVVVGADRIAANGDVANKIGTYGLAVLAKYHGIPFYVAAPASTFDATIATGSDIPIEERDSREVAEFVPDGVEVWNPAFDVTPANLVSAIVTECGVFSPSEACGCISQIETGEACRLG